MQLCAVPQSTLRLRAFIFTSCAVLCFLGAAAWGQNPSTQSTDATAALTQIGNAFSGNKPVSHIQMSGNATWYSGGNQDTGTATLTASASGGAQMQLSMTQKGAWTETQSDIGFGMNCGWAGADGVTHNGDSMNCLKPLAWVLPSISLQPASLPSGVGFADLGMGSVGSVASGSYRHLQSQAVLSAMPSQLLGQSVQASTVDIGYDPHTLLAGVLVYQVHPDNGAPVLIPIEIHYSNYQIVNGVAVPFLIQRYVNGSLQIELRITSAQIN